MTLPRITVYRDRAGQYRWRFQARNGRVIADSSESYTRRHSAERAAYRFLGLARWCTMARGKEGGEGEG